MTSCESAKYSLILLVIGFTLLEPRSIDWLSIPSVGTLTALSGTQPVARDSSLPAGASTTNHKSRAEENKSPNTNDDHRIGAERAFGEGEQLLKEWKAESSRRALDKFKDSLALWKLIGDLQKQTLVLKRIGDVHQGFGEYQPALDSYTQALSLTRRSGNRVGENQVLNALAYLHLTWGNNNIALDLCNQALKLSQTISNKHESARAINNLGEVSYGIGRLQQSIDYYKQALPIWRELADKEGEALTLLNFGYTYSDLGRIKEALSYYNQALSLWEEASNYRGKAMTLIALARLYSRMSENQQALDLFSQGKKLIQPIGDPIWTANAHSGIAYIHDGLGEKQKAIEGYEQALALYRSIKYSIGEANILGDLGRLYFSIGENGKALECHQQALSIFRVIGDRRMEIFELREIGRIYESQGNKTKASTNYKLALAFYRAEKDYRGETDTLGLIGRSYQEAGQVQKALDSFEKGLLLSRKAEYPAGEVAMLYNLARGTRDLGDLVAARSRAEEALRVVESLREKVTSRDLRTSYFASVRQQYEFYIDLLMRMDRERPGEGFATAAFEASERARARTLLETLVDARVGVRDKADPELLKREAKLREELNDREERRMNMPSGGKAPGAETSALTKEIDELVWQLREVEAQIRVGSLGHTTSLTTKPLGLREIQDSVLDDNTLMLQYSLGEERSYVWAVSKTAIDGFELPGRIQIEDAARAVYELLIANQLRAGEGAEQRQERVANANQELPSKIADLSRVLVGPVATKLGTRRLLIVPDGALQYIPFQVLTTATNVNNNGPESRPLVADHTIVNEPSASALAVVLEETKKRKPASDSVAVLADPVFNPDDSRITSARATNTSDSGSSSIPEGELQRAMRDVGVISDTGGIPRLWASRDEADAIIASAPWRSGFKATGFEANKETAMRTDLRNYSAVHFATHGFVNDEHPELSGIVLSLYDQNGQPQDGFLRLHDIYNLKLPVDLVVLSACSTGLGKDVKGEGLIGLTRGFMYAGAGSVVASLWKVDDEATAQLMGYFYRFMLKDGLSPAEALREAQIKMSQQKRWQSPYYWAGFVIQGQYGETARTNHAATQWPALFAGLLAAFGLALFFALYRRRSKIH